MNAATAVPPTGSATRSSVWRLAYLVTGDRAAAGAIVDAVLAGARPGATHAELRSAVVRRARVWAGGHGSAHRDRLWSALRSMPRRRRAEIVQRLR